MKRLPYVILALLVVGLDAFTKMLILRNVRLHTAIPVIENFFQIVHVRNTGAAFGIGANSDSALVPLLLNGGAIIVFFIVVAYSLKSHISDRLLQTGLHLILNVAGNRLHVYENGERTRTYKVSVGMRGYETPAGEKYYYGARVDAAANAAKEAVKQFGASVGKGLESAGEKMKNALDGDGQEAQAGKPE